MPNTTVPAAGKAMPNAAEIAVRDRIQILANEIAEKLDHLPNSEAVFIYSAASKKAANFCFDIAGEHRSEAISEHPWMAARRLMKELSAVLKDCDAGSWAAHILPSEGEKLDRFVRALPRLVDGDPETALDRVERLSWELSDALTDYANGTFQAMVLPSSVGGHTVMLTKISAWDGRAAR